MRQLMAVGIGLALMTGTGAVAAIDQVRTAHGTARIEGSTIYPDVERLVVGDRVVVEPDPEGAQQRVWIAARLGDLLLVGLGSVGNGCYDEYVLVHTGRDDNLRVSDRFGTCGGDVAAAVEGDVVRISMDSPDPNEGRLEYTYDGERVTERVLGQEQSHSPPTASARNWIGRYPGDLFRFSDWREPLVGLIGEEAYKEAQQIMDLTDGHGMQLSNGWVGGLAYGNRESTGSWGAVAISEDDRRLIVVLGHQGEPPRMWGDPRGALPAPIIEAIGWRP